MNFILVCGGTAGHINPALAIANELRRQLPDSNIVFIGSGRDHEKLLIPKAGFELRNIRMSGLLRKVSPEGLLHNIKTVRNVVTAGNAAEKIINEIKPAVVIGTGGYICYPVLGRAAQMGIPTVIHESNAVPGLTSKLLSATVTKILISFPGTEKEYRKPERVVFTGTPVRIGFAYDKDSDIKNDHAAADASERNNENAPESNLPENMPFGGNEFRQGKRPLVVSFWGSLGAEKMNDQMAGFISRNIEADLFDHIHATGRSGKALHDRLEQLGISESIPKWIDIREYIDDMPDVMSSADIVLSRAGASTIAELTVLGKPAVLVPSPYVPRNHQEENAKLLEKAGGAVLLLEKNCTGDVLFETVCSLLEDTDRLKRMSYAQKSLAARDATEKICEIIISLVKKRRNNTDPQ